MTAWWIATSSPCLERRASARLVERGFEVWFPMRDVEFKTRYMKKPQMRQYPLFPGYLFVRPGAGRSSLTYHEMIGADGVRSILMNNWRPLFVSDDRVARLRGDLTELQMAPVEDAYRIGDAVVITKGPFLTIAGEVARSMPTAKGTIKVLMTFLGSPCAVEVPLASLEAA